VAYRSSTLPHIHRLALGYNPSVNRRLSLSCHLSLAARRTWRPLSL